MALFKWNLSDQIAIEHQTIRHIVVEGPRRAYPGELTDRITQNQEVIDCMNNLYLSGKKTLKL